MIVENTHRLDLFTPDEARAYQHLAMAGLSATKIAKRVGDKAARIKNRPRATDAMDQDVAIESRTTGLQ